MPIVTAMALSSRNVSANMWHDCADGNCALAGTVRKASTYTLTVRPAQARALVPDYRVPQA
jgi:hypothetical protein